MGLPVPVDLMKSNELTWENPRRHLPKRPSTSINPLPVYTSPTCTQVIATSARNSTPCDDEPERRIFIACATFRNR